MTNKCFSHLFIRSYAAIRRMIVLMLITTFLWPALAWTINPIVYKSPPHTLPVWGALKQPLQLPEAIGRVQDRYQGSSGQTIICIEDLHCHYEVQKNIASILTRLLKSQDIGIIGLEGGSGTVDLGPLRTFPVAWLRQMAADYFMKQGKLTGAEYFAAGQTSEVELFGVENQVLYQKAHHTVKAFLNMETQGLVADLQDRLKDLKSSVYHKALYAFDGLKTDFRNNKLTIRAYARLLRLWARRVKLILEYSQQQLLERLDDGKIAPQDMEPAGKDLERLDQAIRQKLYQTPQEMKLDQLLARAEMIGRMLSISISNEEWAAYQAHAEDYRMAAFLQFIAQQKKIGDGVEPELYRLDDYLRQVGTFYRLADERSLAFAANVKQRLLQRHEDLAVLIMGGFHRQGVLKALKQQGMNYVVIRPTVTKTDMINPYFNILQDKLLPLEKLLVRTQTNMAPPLWPQAHPMLYRQSVELTLDALARAAWEKLPPQQQQILAANQDNGPDTDARAKLPAGMVIHPIAVQDPKGPPHQVWALITPRRLKGREGTPWGTVEHFSQWTIVFFDNYDQCLQTAWVASRSARKQGVSREAVEVFLHPATPLLKLWRKIPTFLATNPTIQHYQHFLLTKQGIWLHAVVSAAGALGLLTVAVKWYFAIWPGITMPAMMLAGVVAGAVLIILFSLALHEYSHARVAKIFGDNTAEKAGRLTLNIFKHISLPGTIVLPLALAAMHYLFGWPILAMLKPMPINEKKLKNINHVRLVALAGPAANAGLAAAAFISILSFQPLGVVLLWLHLTMTVNALLAVINFIPLSLTDGRKVLAGKAPDGKQAVFEAALGLVFLFKFLPWLIGALGTIHVRLSKKIPLIVNFHQSMKTKINEAFLKDAGGKGRGLINMCLWGAPVPPGFVMRAKASLEVIANRGKLLLAHKAALKRGIRQLNQDTGQTFGDKDNPLLVSVRSGADTSMPGMMETVFFLGLNDETVNGLAKQWDNENYAWYVYSTAIEGFATKVFGIDPKEFEALRGLMAEEMQGNYFKKADSQRLIEEFKEQIKLHGFEFPQDVHQQLAVATERVMNSWNDKEVIDYRERFNVPNTGTGVTVQKMVFGGKNDNSGAGVVYSRDFKTGDNRMTGNWKRARSGQAIVGGLVTPDGINQLKEEIGEAVYNELQHWVKFFETQLKNVVDVEFTVEDGKLYILQVRSAGKKLYPEAKIKVIRHMLNHKLINMEDLFENIDISTLIWMERSLRAPRLPDEIDHALAAVGQGAAVGIKAGRVVFTKRQAMDYADRREPFVLVVERSEKDS